MPNYISQIKLPSGTTYKLKDSEARDLIQNLTGGAMTFLGVATTASQTLTDGSTLTPITRTDGTTASPTTGSVVLWKDKQFIWDGAKWFEFGNMDHHGTLAYKDFVSGTVSYKPAGTVGSTFTGNQATISIPVTPSGTAKIQGQTFTGTPTTVKVPYTPAGSVDLTTGTQKTLVQFYLTSNSDAVDPATIPQEQLVSELPLTGEIDATFSGDRTTFTGNYAPAGSISFTTTNKTAAVTTATGTTTYKPSGSISDFKTGSQTITSTGTYKPEGTVAAPGISIKTAGSTASVKAVDAVRSPVSAINTVAAGNTITNEIVYINPTVTNEQLTFNRVGYTTSAAITTTSVNVKTGDGVYQASAPGFTGNSATVTVTGTASKTTGATFVGDAVRLVTGNIAVPNSFTFSGTSTSISVSGTPVGRVNGTWWGAEEKAYAIYDKNNTNGTGSFTGTPTTLNIPITPAGTVKQPTFAGASSTIQVTYTPTGSVSSTFSGTQSTISMTST